MTITLPVPSKRKSGPAKQRRRAWEPQYLAARAATCSVREACEIAGVSRVVVAEWRKQCERFALEEQAAAEDVSDRAEEAIYKRAVEGWKEPVFWKGEQCGELTRFSDAAAGLWLGANCPDKYDRSKRLQVSGQVKHAHIVLHTTDLDTVPTDQLVHLLTGQEQLVVEHVHQETS